MRILNKIKANIAATLLLALFASNAVFAAFGGGIGTPSFFTLDGDNLELIDANYELGAADARIAKIWADVIDATSVAVTAVAGGVDLDGNDLVLDADGDTIITADTDDQVDIAIAGADDFQFTANLFSVLAGSALNFADDAAAIFGAGSDASLLWETADADANFLNLLLTGSNNLIVSADAGIDWARANSTNPTLFIQSADEASTSEYVALYHDQTDANIVSGSGQLNLVSGNGLVGVPGAVGAGTQRFLIRSAAGNQAGFELGEGAVSSLYFRANHGFDQGVLAVKDQVGSQIVLGCESDQDYDHADQTDPTLFIHSCTAPNTANDEWVSFSHDTTDFSIVTGKGDVIFNAQGGNIAPSANDGAALGISGQAFSDLFLASGAVVNFNAGNVTLTHAADTLTLAADDFIVTGAITGRKSVVGSGINRAVTSTESGTVFTNSAAIEFTLPTAEAGLTYTFIVADANYLRVNMAAGDQADYIGTTTALAGYFRSNNQGDVLEVVAIDDTTWQVTNLEGTWTFDE